MLSVAVLAVLGFYDDYTKIIKASGGGGAKSTGQTVGADWRSPLFIGLYLWRSPATRQLHLITDIMVPFYKTPVATGVGLSAWC